MVCLTIVVLFVALVAVVIGAHNVAQVSAAVARVLFFWCVLIFGVFFVDGMIRK